MSVCMNPMPYFAAIQHNTVFGVGATKHEALNDASEWADSVGVLVVVPCTSAAYLRTLDGRTAGVTVLSDGVMLESEVA